MYSNIKGTGTTSTISTKELIDITYVPSTYTDQELTEAVNERKEQLKAAKDNISIDNVDIRYMDRSNPTQYYTESYVEESTGRTIVTTALNNPAAVASLFVMVITIAYTLTTTKST